MQKRIGTLFLCIAAVMALFAMSAMPALAGDDNKGQEKKEENAQNHQQADQEASSQDDKDGDADSDPSTAYDEDTDTNDGTANNVEDDGDNAHPSGKDRSVENGGSNNQGKSESNPDDSKGPQRYEGARGDDKPNGPGGTDLADQDGNNGCGNDDDFDDDNNGHCGPRTKPTSPPKTCPDGSPMPSNGDCGDDEVKGTAKMTIDVNCYTVTVTSTKDISNVKVYFVDGTSVEINVNSPSFSQTFTKPIDYATSKSSTTTVIDVAPENCTQVGGSGGEKCPSNPSLPMNHKDCNPTVVCPAGTDMAGNVPGLHGCNIPRNSVCPAGTDMAGLPPGVHGCNVDDQFIVCPAGTDYAGFPMNDLKDCNEDDVQGRTDEVNPVKYCPAGGPFAGMPIMDEEDCEAAGGIRDRVLPRVITQGANPLADVAGRVAGNVAGAVGAVLPFTGAGDLYFVAALGLLLIAAGAVGLQLRKN